jgi:hypothetical protein
MWRTQVWVGRCFGGTYCLHLQGGRYVKQAELSALLAHILNHEHGDVTKRRKTYTKRTYVTSIYIITGVRTSKPIYTRCRKSNGGVSVGSASKHTTGQHTECCTSTFIHSNSFTSGHPQDGEPPHFARLVVEVRRSRWPHSRRLNCLHPLECWGRGFQFQSRHECWCAFILCVGSGLATGWSPSKESYRLCTGLRNHKNRPGPNKGL